MLLLWLIKSSFAPKSI